MWTIFHVLQVIVYLFVVVAGVFWIVTDLWPNYIGPWLGYVQKAVKQAPDLQANGRVIHREEPEPTPNEVIREAIPVDEARAGQVISDVPNYAPGSKSWKANRTVVTTALANIYTPQGVANTLFVWLSGDMLIMKTPKKWFLLTELPITSAEAIALLRERKELLDDVKAGDETPDQVIREFRGCQWEINGAYGLNEGGRNPGQSTIECTSVLSELGEFEDDVPTLVTTVGRPVSYYDMRADWVSGDQSFAGRRMVAMWAEEGSDCVVYVGKEMSPAEVKQMGVV
jgi:hypothetical protein